MVSITGLLAFIKTNLNNFNEIDIKKELYDEGDEWNRVSGYTYNIFQDHKLLYRVGAQIIYEDAEDWAQAETYESYVCCKEDFTRADINEIYDFLNKRLK